MTDDRPTMQVSTEHVNIHVCDRQTARLALELVDSVLVEYLGEATGIIPEQNPAEKFEYTVTCPECDHTWERRAQYPERATCPECNSGFKVPKDVWNK